MSLVNKKLDPDKLIKEAWADADRHGKVATVNEIDLSALPKAFDDEDFGIVAKEAWIVGLWISRVNPGYIEVAIETDGYSSALLVASYRKKWNETEWKLVIP
jgi:hypothetical protein